MAKRKLKPLSPVVEAALEIVDGVGAGIATLLEENRERYGESLDHPEILEARLRALRQAIRVENWPAAIRAAFIVGTVAGLDTAIPWKETADKADASKAKRRVTIATGEGSMEAQAVTAKRMFAEMAKAGTMKAPEIKHKIARQLGRSVAHVRRLLGYRKRAS